MSRPTTTWVTRLIAAGEFEAGARCFEQALRLNPVHAGAHGNLGVSRKNEGKLAEAAACFEQALAIDPKDTQALWNRSLLRLLTGDYLGGWPDYEARWAQPGKVARRFAQPRWDGSSLAGKTILVYAEQGLGDTLQFLRYLPMVTRPGAVGLSSNVRRPSPGYSPHAMAWTNSCSLARRCPRSICKYLT